MCQALSGTLHKQYCNNRKLSLVFCDDLEGWDWGWDEREAQERWDTHIHIHTHTHTHTYTRLIYNTVQQKLTQHCKVIIFLQKI